jgi:hypothetical protein
MTPTQIREALISLPNLTAGQRHRLKNGYDLKLSTVLNILTENKARVSIETDEPISLHYVINKIAMDKRYDTIFPTFTDEWGYEWFIKGKDVRVNQPVFVSLRGVTFAKLETTEDFYNFIKLRV